MSKLSEPDYVDDGQNVIVPLGDGTARGIRGVVTCAAGKHARVKTPRFERWFALHDIRIEATS